MTPELTALTFAALWQVCQFIHYTILADRELGVKVTGGARDTLPPLSTKLGRVQRAFENHFEGLIMFTIAVVVITLSDQSTQLTAICAWVFVAARVAYVPAYILAIGYLRSAIWIIGFLSTVVMLLAALF